MDGFVPPPDGWDVVIKVKYGDTLKRFNARVKGAHFDQNLSTLRSKITTAFKFCPDADFILTYTDEDGDVVMLDDDDDLHDAAVCQKLNPLRINLRLKSRAGTSQTTQQTSNTIPSRSTAREDGLAQIKSAIDEALKSIPEPVPSVVAQISHELLSRAAASAPQLSELLDHVAGLMKPDNNSQPSNEPTGGLSDSSTELPQTLVNLKVTDEPKAPNVSASLPLDMQNSGSTKARDLKSVLVETPVAPTVKAPQDPQASGYPSIEELLFSTGSAGNKSVCQGSNDAKSKGKSVMSSATPPFPPIFASVRPAPPPPPPPPPPSVHPPPSMCEWSPRPTPPIWPFEAGGKVANDSRPPWGRSISPAPPSYSYIPFRPSPHIPYPSRLLSSGHLVRGLDDQSIPSRTFHRWIQCDGCGMQPIFGPRYKSNVKEDYDLCSTCFTRMGNEAEYTRLDKPISPRILRDPNMCRRSQSRILTKSKRDKLESRFILDVTILDGTLMSPSTAFTKIWRMRNNGSTMWPFGTQLIWVGGDQFASQNSVQLEIPVNGFPVDKEIDVAVDFVAPARPGRYISYWRLAAPSGQKFGQRVWVLIQVEQPTYTNGNNQSAAINLNLPPESNSTNAKHLIDMNVEPVDTCFGEYDGSTKAELLEPLIYHGVIKPKESGSAPSAMPSVSAAPVPPSPAGPAVPDHIIDLPSSSASRAYFVPFDVDVPEPPINVPVNVPATEPVNVPISVPLTAPSNVPVDVPAMAHVDELASPAINVTAPAPVNTDILMEEKLLKELEEMGFRQVDLNKEILRQNKYNLEQSVDDLCGFTEWDPLLAELQDMGFDDTEMNKELLVKNGGSIKRAVMELVAREKKDQ